MMEHFLAVFILFDILQITSNQKCTGVEGNDVCCLGFSLNGKTGKCEKCHIGFFGKDCAKKCSYPFYGEDCQYKCVCPKHDCHVSHGCFANFPTLVYQELSSPRIYSAKPSTASPSVSIQDKEFSYPTASQDFSTDIHKHVSDYEVDSNPSNDDWLKNSVALSLFGIFVLFFSVFVIAYIYFKCFRKETNAKSNNKSELQVQYRSLSLDTRQPMGTAYEEPQEEVIADSMYLSPVFGRNEGNEISSYQINDMRIDNTDALRETTGGGHNLSHVPTYTENETNSSVELEERTNHIYNEIAESSNLAVRYAYKTRVSSNIEKNTAMGREVLYMNVKSEQF